MTEDLTLTLDRWRNRFRVRDNCPWPGPRPLGSNDKALLVGRNETRQEFGRVIQQHRLVLLHGSSGVGKTSLLQAGLIPDLDRSGSTIFSVDLWGGAHGQNVRLFLADKLGLSQSDGDPFENLNTSLNDQAVLVLDQFEELVRYSPSTAQNVFELILDLNRRFAFKIIISFRSEYLHEFAGLEDNAVNFSVTQFPLGEVDDDAAIKVILAGNKDKGHPDAIDTSAADLLAAEWRTARTEASEQAGLDDPFGRVGLLHLQAMLYALHFANGQRSLTRDSVHSIIATDICAGTLEKDHIGAQAFRFALQRAIDFKLEHCEWAARGDGGDASALDESITEGTRWMLARTALHLSSAGYKLIRGAQELARLALGVDFEALRDGLEKDHHEITAEQEKALFEAVLASAQVGESGAHRSRFATDDLLAIRRKDIAVVADQRQCDQAASVDTWLSRIDDQRSSSFENDPLDVTCGPMMGLTPADVLIEEFRRFAFALVWMEASSLVRITTPVGSSAMVSLIHDGFGAALTRWAERVRKEPAGPLEAITAPRGASFAWSLAPATANVSRPSAVNGDGAESRHRFLPNLRWRGGWVQADFDHVAFLNCDFRGTLFDGCRMSGVTFVNCLLDGAILSDCILSGPQADVADDEGWSESEPDFVISAPISLVSAHAQARSLQGKVEAAFLCGLPGGPAVPYRGEPTSTRIRFPDDNREEEARRLEVHLDDGGVAVHGGRISSLVLRRCLLEEGSGITLRHTTGSGLELVEIEDAPGRFEIYGSAVRQISISSKVAAQEKATVHIRAAESAIAQVWVGPNLRGSFTVTGSLLIHAWNGSPTIDGPDSGVKFIARDCTINGLLDVEVLDCNEVGDGRQTERAADLGIPGVIDQLARMDYRRNPAQSDHELRAAT